MARKPNYRADRIERDRAKAAKKAKRSEARAEKSARAKGIHREDADMSNGGGIAEETVTPDNSDTPDPDKTPE